MDENKKEFSEGNLENANKDTENIVAENIDNVQAEEMIEPNLKEETTEDAAVEEESIELEEKEEVVETETIIAPVQSATKSKKGLIIGVLVAGIVLCVVGAFALMGGNPTKTVEKALNNVVSQSKAVRAQLDKDFPANKALQNIYKDNVNINMSIAPLEVYGGGVDPMFNMLLSAFKLDVNMAIDAKASTMQMDYGIAMGDKKLLSLDMVMTPEKAIFGVPELIKNYYNVEYATMAEDIKTSPLNTSGIITQDDIDQINVFGGIYKDYPGIMAGVMENDYYTAVNKDIDAVSNIFIKSIIKNAKISKGADVDGGTEYLATLTAEHTDALSKEITTYLKTKSSLKTLINYYESIIDASGSRAEFDSMVAEIADSFKLQETKLTMVIKSDMLNKFTLETKIGDAENYANINIVGTLGEKSVVEAKITPNGMEKGLVVNIESSAANKLYSNNIGISYNDGYTESSGNMSIILDGNKTEENYIIGFGMNMIDEMTVSMTMPFTIAVQENGAVNMNSAETEMSMEMYGEKIGIKIGVDCTYDKMTQAISVPESKNIFKLTQAEIDAIEEEYMKSINSLVGSFLGM